MSVSVCVSGPLHVKMPKFCRPHTFSNVRNDAVIGDKAKDKCLVCVEGSWGEFLLRRVERHIGNLDVEDFV